MIKRCLLLILVVAGVDAAFIKVETPGVTYADRQPLEAVVVDGKGNTSNQTFYYNAGLGGVDYAPVDANAAASIFFPSLQVGYLWNNGYWVDHSGYYWSGGHRYYTNHPNWHGYWGGYWNAHPHGGWNHGYHGSSFHYHGGYDGDHYHHFGDHGGEHHGEHHHEGEHHGGEHHGGGHK